jgi:mRNA-degrading endonuclease RelE of RelBE toxin-antitoxin system
MTWDLQLASAAERFLRKAHDPDKTRIISALGEMKADPLGGDTVALKGEYQGMFRRRVGSWRILFRVKSAEQVILVADIVRRGSTTY